MKKIRVGIIGVHPDKGWASLAHIPALQSLPEDFEITAISNNTLEQAQLAAKKYNIPHAFGSTKELVTHPAVDLVVVTVKVTHHFELIMPAIEAGKAVYAEWPLGIHLAEAMQIADRARQKKVHTVIGLQTRSAPAFNYVKDLIKEGYVGEVLSTTLIGSGINWGEAMNVQFKYTLDSQSGAGMLHVPFAHSIDAVLHALDTNFEQITANLAIRRKSSQMLETGEDIPMRTPDQIAVSGTLKNGAFIATHFRGGLSKGTNFHWEINGTRGDLIVTTPVGYIGIGGFRVQGFTTSPQWSSREGEASGLQDLAIPAKYGIGLTELGLAQNVALNYANFAQDLRTGSRQSPTFDDAVNLHHLIQSIETSAENDAFAASLQTKGDTRG